MTAGRWGANKAGEAAVGVKNSILDNAIDPAMEMGAEKKAKYLEAGAVMSEAFSKLAGKEVTLSEKQILALGATMDAGGFLKDIAEKGADTMAHMLLVEDGIDIARNLKQAGIDPEPLSSEPANFRRAASARVPDWLALGSPRNRAYPGPRFRPGLRDGKASET